MPPRLVYGSAKPTLHREKVQRKKQTKANDCLWLTPLNKSWFMNRFKLREKYISNQTMHLRTGLYPLVLIYGATLNSYTIFSKHRINVIFLRKYLSSPSKLLEVFLNNFGHFFVVLDKFEVIFKIINPKFFLILQNV